MKEDPMKKVVRSISVGMFILSLAGCALIPDLPPAATPTPALPPSGYEPQPGDDKLQRDKVFLDVENSSVMIRESLPAQVSVMLNGSLSDPCHQLRVVVTSANVRNEINLDVYSVFDPGVACITVIRPFSATIPVGNYAGGHFTVYVNGQLAGEFDA
jgi:hypothetical protein